MTVCVGSSDEWKEVGKMGPRAQRLAYISFHPPWLLHPNFFYTLNRLFSPVCPMNYVNDWGIPFACGQMKKDEVQEMPPHFFFSSLCCLWTTFHVGSVGLGLSSLAMWKDVGGCWVGAGGGSGHNDIHEELRRQERKRMPVLLLDGLTLINEKEKDRENTKRGVALV